MTTYATPTDVLPHRPPFLFIDRVLECTDARIRAVRTFRPDEEFFAGHFPGNPIVPGVLLVEAMAQALAYLALRHAGTKAVYLTGIDRARFRKPVLPGDEVEIEVQVDGIRMGLISARGEARVRGVKVADARLSGFAEK